MSQAILTDSFRLLQDIPTEELESRIEWLEASLMTYKQLLIIKQLMERRPHLLETPPHWQSVLDMPQDSQNLTLTEQMDQWLQTNSPATLTEIQIALHCSEASVYNIVKKLMAKGRLAKKPNTRPVKYEYLFPDRQALTDQERADLEEEELKDRERYAVPQ